MSLGLATACFRKANPLTATKWAASVIMLSTLSTLILQRNVH